MPNYALLVQLYGEDLQDVWIVDGEATILANKQMEKKIDGYINASKNPGVYLCQVSSINFAVMKDYFASARIEALGLEKIGTKALKDILDVLPASVKTISVDRMGIQAMDFFCAKMKEFKDANRGIRIISGELVATNYKAKFITLSGDVTVISTPRSTLNIAKMLADGPEEQPKTSKKHNRKRKSDMPCVESSADLIMRQIKHIRQLETAVEMNPTAKSYLSLLERNKSLEKEQGQLHKKMDGLLDRNTFLTNELTTTKNKLFILERDASGLHTPVLTPAMSPHHIDSRQTAIPALQIKPEHTYAVDEYPTFSDSNSSSSSYSHFTHFAQAANSAHQYSEAVSPDISYDSYRH